MKIEDLFPKRKLKAKVADTPSKCEKGLMFCKSLKEDEGMIFLFKFATKLNFWGENTYLPLDLAFMSDSYRIVKITSISPCSRKLICSDFDCKIAIEANYGFFKKNNINVGDIVLMGKTNDGEIDIEFKKDS